MRRSELHVALEDLLQLVDEAGIQCRFAKDGGCDEVLVYDEEPCELCFARAALARAEGALK